MANISIRTKVGQTPGCWWGGPGTALSVLSSPFMPTPMFSSPSTKTFCYLDPFLSYHVACLDALNFVKQAVWFVSQFPA